MRASLVASFDLPRERWTRELSGLAWDDAAKLVFAISDKEPLIIALAPSPGYRTWSRARTVAVEGAGPWDGEGIALVDGGFLVANEIGPRLLELDPTGRVAREIATPPHFSRCPRNAAFESLSLTPDKRFLFTANEGVLAGDAPSASTRQGGVVRILRIDRTTGARAEFAYRSDPILAEGERGGIGIVDIAAFSATDLLVLERSYVPTVGNSIRVYRTNLQWVANVVDVEALTETAPHAPKTLVVDIASIDGQDVRKDRSTGRGLYPNYEGLALGPRLDDGRRVLFLVSDDNGQDEQTARLLTLALDGAP